MILLWMTQIEHLSAGQGLLLITLSVVLVVIAQIAKGLDLNV